MPLWEVFSIELEFAVVLLAHQVLDVINQIGLLQWWYCLVPILSFIDLKLRHKRYHLTLVYQGVELGFAEASQPFFFEIIVDHLHINLVSVCPWTYIAADYFILILWFLQ